MKKISEQPIGKLLIMMRKAFQDAKNRSHLTHTMFYKIEEELKIFGIKSITVKEYSFIIEFFKLNNENLINKTLTNENVILPELKKVKLQYFQYETYTEERMWRQEVETYSTEKLVCKQFFDGESNQAEDAIDIYSTEPYSNRITDSTIDGDGIHIDKI
jgi:hypothetical protein